MKKSLFLIAALCFAFVANAQYMPNANKAAVKVKAFNGNEVIKNTNPTSVGNLPKEVFPVGSTVYDLQSNSASDKRIVKHADGTITVVWTFGNDAAGGYSDRGTGFNYFDGTTWGQVPTARISSETAKHGWPTPGEADGGDYVIAHNGSGYDISMNSAFGASDWALTPITSGTSTGMTWPRTAFSGNYLHVISAGGDFGGIGDMLTYQRSTDGGTTWEDAILLPGLDTSKVGAVGGDGYAIDADEAGNVVVGSFDETADIAVVKSTDNGASWTPYVILDFPDAFEPFDGANFDNDGDGKEDTLDNASNDGAVVLDHNGKVHVVFGRMKHVLVGGLWYPYWDELVYWNEDMAQDSFDINTDMPLPSNVVLVNDDMDTIAWTPDLNGNDTIDLIEGTADVPFGKYYLTMSCFPTISVTEDNDIIVMFSAVMEGNDYLVTTAAPNAQHVRHLWVTVRDSETGLWSEMEHVSDYAGFELTENVFASSYKYAEQVGDSAYVDFIFQNDNEPGLSVRGDEDPGTTNYILHNTLAIYNPVGINEMTTNTASFSVRPNPVQDVMTIESADNAQISIFNVIGSEVLRIENANKSQEINVSTLPEGSYIVRVKTENGVSAQKIIKK